MSCKCNTDIFRILYTFHYPFSPISMGFAPCDARVLAGLTDSTLDLFKRSLFTITKETIFLKKAGSLEGTAFVHSSFQRRNKTLWVLWNFLDTWKLFYLFYLFLPKRKSKIMFSPARLSNLYIYKKAWTWAKWTEFSVCSHVLFIVNGCNFNIKTLKPSRPRGFFFFFLFNGYCAWTE